MSISVLCGIWDYRVSLALIRCSRRGSQAEAKTCLSVRLVWAGEARSRLRRIPWNAGAGSWFPMPRGRLYVGVFRRDGEHRFAGPATGFWNRPLFVHQSKNAAGA